MSDRVESIAFFRKSRSARKVLVGEGRSVDDEQLWMDSVVKAQAGDTGAMRPGVVSIVIPVYNCAPQLVTCIESAIGQSYTNVELLLVDDGSTDSSGKLCDEYARLDSRIHVEHSSNRGPASARNLGIAKSTGEFLFFLDADDRIEKNAINLLMENWERTQSDLVIGDFTIERPGARSSASQFLYQEDALFLKHDIVSRTLEYLKKPTAFAFLTYVWGKLFRASIVRGKGVLFNPELRIFEDIDFNVRYLGHADSASYIRNKLYRYTNSLDSGATTHGLSAEPLGFKPALDGIQKFLIASGVAETKVQGAVGNAIVYFAIRTMIALFMHGQRVSLWKKHQAISQLVNDVDIRDNLEYYSPAKGDSKIIPALIRLKLTSIIVAICLYKVNKKLFSKSQRAAWWQIGKIRRQWNATV
jgi:glycosyltransferase involved in cell wall biosynthesis